MSDEKLHEGIWVRQVLKWKRKVRVSFIPDNVTDSPQYTNISIDDDSKAAWERLFGDLPDDVDIDLGTILVRFKANGLGGTATFLPDRSTQVERVHEFQQSTDPSNAPVVGLGEFATCIENKRAALGENFNLPLAVSECLPQWSV